MITGDLDRALGTGPISAGTWRPAPPGCARATGAYATPVAFVLAHAGQVPERSAGGAVAHWRRVGAGPGRAWPPGEGPGGETGPAPGAEPGAAVIADALASRLDGLEWVLAAGVTGGGYLTVTVSDTALGMLAVRVSQSGPACVRSDALRGVALTAPPAPDLARSPTWQAASQWLAAHLRGRLAEAAGASVTWPADREPPAWAPGAGGGPSVVADGIAHAGPDAITSALSLLPPGSHREIDPSAAAAQRDSNPAYAVRYAHAHAASVLRQAADLGLDQGEANGFQPRLLAHPSERALLYELSWLPERAARAARRGRPDVFARYLTGLAGAYLGCHQGCPAVWPGMALPGGAGNGLALTAARLWLVSAVRTALAAGLDTLGIGAPGWL